MSATSSRASAALGDLVRAALYEAIAYQRLPAGERINVDQVARELAVSPTPVREALAMLESEHVVVKRHRVGYVTTPVMTAAEVAQLFELRRHVEPWLAGEAADRVRTGDVDGGDLAEPDAGADALEGAAVHDAIARLSGQLVAQRALLAMNSHLQIQRCYVAVDARATSGDEHRAVVAAIRAGDPDQARTAMSDHLDAAGRRVAALLES